VGADPGRRYARHLRSYDMNTVAIDYIWQAILESEGSDDIQFMDDELRLNAGAARLTHLPRLQSGAIGREPLATTTIGPALSQ
jgi:hypothetical protein